MMSSDREFQSLRDDLTNGSLSVYRGDGSKEFAIEVAAANSISSNHVKNVEMVILHASPWMSFVKYLKMLQIPTCIKFLNLKFIQYYQDGGRIVIIIRI